MIVWILGIFDFIVMVNLIFLHFGFLQSLATISIIYLILKWIIFIADPFSVLDIIIGVYMILLFFGISTFLTWIFVLYLAYKVIISFTH